MHICRLALAALLLAAPSLALAEPELLLAEDAAVLPVTIQCESCGEEAPTISLLWRGAALGDPGILRTLVSRDWASGAFVLLGEQGDVAIQASPVENGWSLQVPVADLGLPFRVVTTLHGHVADHAAWWPAQDRRPVSVNLSPLADVLDAHPSWDPARSAECDVLIPKSAETPIVFVDAGQPQAWLFPTPGAASAETPGAASADPTAWTFQFVRPGASLLERVSVAVTAFDEGDSWALRVPLEATLRAPTREFTPGPAGAVPLASSPTLEPADAAPPRAVTLSGVGALSLGDCPRAVR